MPTYQVSLPGGERYEVASDRELTDQEAFQYASTQSPRYAKREEIKSDLESTRTAGKIEATAPQVIEDVRNVVAGAAPQNWVQTLTDPRLSRYGALGIASDSLKKILGLEQFTTPEIASAVAGQIPGTGKISGVARGVTEMGAGLVLGSPELAPAIAASAIGPEVALPVGAKFAVDSIDGALHEHELADQSRQAGNEGEAASHEAKATANALFAVSIVGHPVVAEKIGQWREAVKENAAFRSASTKTAQETALRSTLPDRAQMVMSQEEVAAKATADQVMAEAEAKAAEQVGGVPRGTIPERAPEPPKSTSEIPTEPVSAAAPTGIRTPLLVNAHRRGNMIRLEFDLSTGIVPTEEQVQQMFSNAGHTVEVTRFAPNEFSTAQGRVNFRVDVTDEIGRSSSENAKRAYKEILGTSEDITGKSSVEAAIPFEERFTRSIRGYQRRAHGAATPEPPNVSSEIPAESAAATAPVGEEQTGTAGVAAPVERPVSATTTTSSEVSQTPTLRQRLYQEGLYEDDVTDLLAGKITVAQAVDRRLAVNPLPGTSARPTTPDHIAAVKEARANAIERISKIVEEQKPAAPAAQPQEANASSQQQATAVYGDVRPQPVEGAGQVPVAQGSGGVQPQAGGRISAPSGGTPTQVGPGIVGMGGAVLGEFERGKGSPTAMKFRMIDEERQKRGLPPLAKPESVSDQAVLDAAMARIDRDPELPDRLVKELNSKPRPISDEENMVLLIRKIELRDQYERSAREAAQAYDDKRMLQVAEANVRTAEWSDRLTELESASRKSGSERGRALRSLQVMANEDFTLASLETRLRAARGGKPITDVERANLIKIADEYKARADALEKHLAERQKDIDRLEAQRVLAELKAQEAAKPPYHPRILDQAEKIAVFMDRQGEAALKRIRQKMAQLGAGPDPTMLADLAVYGASKLTRGAVEFAKWADEMARDVGDWIKPHLDDIWKASQKKLDEMVEQSSPKAPSKEKAEVKKAVRGPRKTDLEKAKDRIRKQITDLEDRLGRGDLKPKTRRTIALDEEGIRLKAALERVRERRDKMIRDEELAGRKWWQKMLYKLVQVERAFKLSSPAVFGKLAAAAMTRVVTTATEEITGAIGGTLPFIRTVARQAPREGGINVKAMAAGLTEALTKGMADAIHTMRTGKSILEEAIGKEAHMDREWLNMFGQLHGMMKAPIKRGEYTLSLRKRIEHAIRNGIDVTDPAVQTQLQVEALDDGFRSIFMQRGFTSDKFNQFIGMLEKDKRFPVAGEVAARAARFFFPIVRVPVNIVAETATGVYGVPVASVRTMFHAVRGTLDTLDPKTADSIMRQFKKGSIGLGLMAVGYFNADNIGGFYQPNQKRKPGDVGPAQFRIGGVDIPRWMTHAPWFELMQIGATIHRVSHRFLKGHELGFSEGAIAASFGLVEETPFIDEMIRVGEALRERNARTAFIGELAKGTLVPQAVQWIAKQSDTSDIKRKPKTVAEHIKMGIPGLREEVRP